MHVFFKLILQIEILNTSFEIGLRSVPENTFGDESTLFQVMAWCRQAKLTEICLHMASPGHSDLTHLPLDKMAAISQMTFSNAFSWMEM